MPRPKKTKPASLPNAKLLVFLLLIFLLLLGFYFGVLFGRKSALNSFFDPKQDIARNAANSKCVNNARREGDFLLTYTVVQGDTLLSIAKSQLGSTSRVNEIIALNKNKYKLSVQMPFLEQGWILFLPPAYIKNSSGELVEESGELLEINKATSEWSIGGKNFTSFHLRVSNNTHFPQNENFNLGDCIKLIYDMNTRYVYLTEHQ